MSFAKFERNFFRYLNAVVEPAVRHGIGSPRFTPASLIVLETTGFKSGQQRRTPLWSLRLGRYRLISTARGGRSFWVKNLQKDPEVGYYLAGRRRDSEAVVFAPGEEAVDTSRLPRILQGLVRLIAPYTRRGWAFAVLLPA
jgi:deazaflavin-dependent oxidoreductase (nitroreductase family)